MRGRALGWAACGAALLLLIGALIVGQAVYSAPLIAPSYSAR